MLNAYELQSMYSENVFEKNTYQNLKQKNRNTLVSFHMIDCL